MYRHITKEWLKHWKSRSTVIKQRAMKWRRAPAIAKVERPSRLDRAHALGYKAKQGIIVVRVRVGRGGMRKKRPNAGRRPKHLGTTRIKAAVSMQEVSERRAGERFPNMKVLGSYFVYRDGRHQWHEVVMADPHHPSIAADRDLAPRVGLLST